MMKTACVAIVILLASLPQLAHAQVEPVGTVSEDPAYVYRTFDSLAPYGAETQWGTAYSIEFTGYELLDERDARRAYQQMAQYVVMQVPTDLGAAVEASYPSDAVVPQGAVEVPAPRLGDEAFAATIELQVDIDLDQYWSVLVLRQDARMLVAFGTSYDSGADLIGMLAAIVEPTLPRWETGDAVQVTSDGVRYGGIWNMMPTEADVPVGFELNRGMDEGPAPDGAAPRSTSFDTSLRIVLLGPVYQVLDDGTCEGIQGFNLFWEHGEVAVMTPDGSRVLAVVSPDAPGQLINDPYYAEEVCVFYLTFEDLPVIDSYGFGVPGKVAWTLTHAQLSQAAVIEVVLEVPTGP